MPPLPLTEPNEGKILRLNSLGSNVEMATDIEHVDNRRSQCTF